MKTSILVSLTVASSLFLAACGNSKSVNEGDQTTEVKAESISPEAVELNNPVLNAVYHEYINLNEALVNGNEEEAKIAANTLELGAKELENGATIAANAANITEAGTLKEKREFFSKLSNALIPLVKASGVKSGELYIDYCPMALNDQGAHWLSSEKGIKNPYFGDSMLTCGETKETIS
ncbi:MAG TPA: DUF3347 domain-containing protein [Sphingobacteriaceae bacterium]|nr:DUF3347 domain-containing protein [Sphingobacteriaceae bacterium]